MLLRRYSTLSMAGLLPKCLHKGPAQRALGRLLRRQLRSFLYQAAAGGFVRQKLELEFEYLTCLRFDASQGAIPPLTVHPRARSQR